MIRFGGIGCMFLGIWILIECLVGFGVVLVSVF